MFNLKKAIFSGVVYYSVMYLFINLLMFSLAITDPMIQSAAVWIFTVILVYLLATEYYFPKKVKDPVKEGFMFGLSLAIISAIIEIPIMVYGFAAEMGWAWFTQWHIAVWYLLTIVASVVIAMKK